MVLVAFVVFMVVDVVVGGIGAVDGDHVSDPFDRNVVGDGDVGVGDGGGVSTWCRWSLV